MAVLLAPVASVRAATSVPVKKSKTVRPQPVRTSAPNLPIVTPLTVTELESDVTVPQTIATLPTSANVTDRNFIPPTELQSPQFIPTAPSPAIAPQEPAAKPVPAVAKLPQLDFVPSSPRPQSAIAPSLQPLTKQGRDLGKRMAFNLPQAPNSPRFIPTETSISFSPEFRAAPDLPAIALPESTDFNVVDNPIATEFVPLTTTNSPQILARATSNPIVKIDRQNRVTTIQTTASAQAQIPEIAPATPSPSTVVEIPELPRFVGGTPVYAFNGDRSRRIVATAIAQVGSNGELAAPEPSISIPVEPPKQNTIPAPSAPVKQPTVIPIKTMPAEPANPQGENVVAVQTGQASWYGLEAGSKTASGERLNPKALTAAHRTLPFGTRVRVTNLKNGRSVTVRINDRGPFIRRRIIDISEGAAEVIGIKSTGVGNVRLEILAAAKPNESSR